MTLTINALLVAVESTWTEGDETEIIALLKKFVEVMGEPPFFVFFCFCF
jgi:hypothetical protein